MQKNSPSTKARTKICIQESHLLPPELDQGQINPKPRKPNALEETQTKNFSN